MHNDNMQSRVCIADFPRKPIGIYATHIVRSNRKHYAFWLPSLPSHANGNKVRADMQRLHKAPHHVVSHFARNRQAHHSAVSSERIVNGVPM